MIMNFYGIKLLPKALMNGGILTAFPTVPIILSCNFIFRISFRTGIS